MQTPVEIDFQGMAGSTEIRDDIARRIAELEERYGRVTACRVVLKGPGRHHRGGGLYEVNIRLALPNGREVNVARTAPADERHSDLDFELNDAFKRARRRLQRSCGLMRPGSSASWNAPMAVRSISIATACWMAAFPA